MAKARPDGASTEASVLAANPHVAGILAAHEAKKKQNKVRYEFNPVGMDAFDPQPFHPAPGANVVQSNKSGIGKPPGATGKHYKYVEGADSGEFHGMVLKNSLQRVTKDKPVANPHPEASAMVNGLFNDRRAQK